MAQFSKAFQYSYQVLSDGMGGYILRQPPIQSPRNVIFVSTDNDQSQFNVGETLATNLGGYSFTYIGVGSDGIFTIDNFGNFKFYTDTPNLDNETRTLDPIDAQCFLQGVLIATTHGERPVEDLRIGDRVALADGGEAVVRWIGRDRRAAAFCDPLRAMPVRICAGALGDNLPVRDLCLSPDHAVFLDGVLIQAGALVNGTTITRMTAEETGEQFTYFHIELEQHALIVADGMPVESFVANVGRARFENFSEYEILYGEERFIEEMPHPRAQSWRQVPAAVKAQLQALLVQAA